MNTIPMETARLRILNPARPRARKLIEAFEASHPWLQLGGATLRGKRWFVVQHRKFAPAQFCETQRAALSVAKLDFEDFGCEIFDNRSDRAARQAKRRLIIKQRNDIEEFGRYRLHSDSHRT